VGELAAKTIDNQFAHLEVPSSPFYFSIFKVLFYYTIIKQNSYPQTMFFSFFQPTKFIGSKKKGMGGSTSQ